MAARFCAVLALVASMSTFAHAENTNAVALDETVKGVPQDASKATSAVVDILAKAIDDQLHSTSFQWVVALVALIMGKVMCIDGSFVFKYLLVAAVALFAYLMTMQVIKQSHPDFGSVLYIIISAEVCALVSAIAFLGFEGLKYVIGFAVGLALAFYLHMLAQHEALSFADNWIFIVFGANICVLIGVYPFSGGKGHHRAMAFIFSLCGSCLITSALAYFFLLLAQHWNFLGQHLGCEVPTAQPFWVDHMLALCYAGTKTVGVWANCPGGFNHAKILGMDWGIDRIVGRIVWLALFFTGFKIQVKIHKKMEEKKKAKKVEESKPEGKMAGFMSKFKRDKADSKQEPLLC